MGVRGNDEVDAAGDMYAKEGVWVLDSELWRDMLWRNERFDDVDDRRDKMLAARLSAGGVGRTSGLNEKLSPSVGLVVGSAVCSNAIDMK